MNKEVLLVLLDVSPSMWQTPFTAKKNSEEQNQIGAGSEGSSSSYLELAVVAVNRLIRQKVNYASCASSAYPCH